MQRATLILVLCLTKNDLKPFVKWNIFSEIICPQDKIQLVHFSVNFKGFLLMLNSGCSLLKQPCIISCLEVFSFFKSLSCTVFTYWLCLLVFIRYFVVEKIRETIHFCISISTARQNRNGSFSVRLKSKKRSCHSNLLSNTQTLD